MQSQSTPVDRVDPEARVIFVKDLRVVLTLSTGGSIILAPHFLGSDPNVVAAVINYYRAHPEQRPLLSDPHAALDHVEEALASSSKVFTNGGHNAIPR
jgi:hypothetical protein